MLRNIEACRAIAQTVQTSLGPYGRNKIVINHLQKMILTSDAATILRELDVVHPAAKLIVMASQQQEAEMGDATNMVIVLAGELLKKAEELLRMGLKASDIVQGYERAQREALKILDRMIYFYNDIVLVRHGKKLTLHRSRRRRSQRHTIPIRTQQSHPHRRRLQTIRQRRLPRQPRRRSRPRRPPQKPRQLQRRQHPRRQNHGWLPPAIKGR